MSDLEFGDVFLDTNKKTPPMKEKMIKLELFKIKPSCCTKDIVMRNKREATDWLKIFVRHISDGGLVSNMYTELSKLKT